MLGGVKMGHGFYDAIVHAKGMTNQILAIAGYSTCQKLAVRIFLIKIGKVIAHGNDGIALIALVEGVQKLAGGTDNGNFDSRAAGVDADKGLCSLLRCSYRNRSLKMACMKGLILLFVLKKRLHMLEGVSFASGLQLRW